MGKERVVAIIQARMGSSRLPGKVLMPLAGKPVLWHIVHRLRKAKLVDLVAIATSTNAADDPLAEFATQENIPCVRGSEDNVLARYALAADKLQADIVVRITGDAPLVDPAVVDLLVANLVRDGADYCIGEPDVPVIHEGFCPFTAKALARLVNEAATDPVAKEHVSAYFKQHPGSFHIVYVPICTEHRFQGARISVDTPADLCFLETIYKKLNVAAGEADISDVVSLLKKEPNLLEINSHIYQKKPADKTRTILFRCDGNAQIGLGHVVRCLALAEIIRNEHGYGVTFVMANGKAGFELVQKAGFPVVYQIVEDQCRWFADIVASRRPDAIVLDVRSGLTRTALRVIREQGVLVVSLDDPTDLRLEVDLVFYPPVPQVESLDWGGFGGKRYVGWEWVVLRQQFAALRATPVRAGRHLLITMGGSDPAGLTGKVIDLLQNNDQAFSATIVVGAGNPQVGQLRQQVRAAKRSFQLLTDVEDMANLMGEADLVIATFGVTAYELAAMERPMLLLCLNEDHFASASLFDREGMARVVAVYKQGWGGQLAALVQEIMGDEGCLCKMGRAAQGKVDGRGVYRIAQVVVESVEGKEGEG